MEENEIVKTIQSGWHMYMVVTIILYKQKTTQTNKEKKKRLQMRKRAGKERKGKELSIH
jgi:hypothetical protein